MSVTEKPSQILLPESMLTSDGEPRLASMFNLVWASRWWLAKVAGAGLIAATIVAVRATPWLTGGAGSG